MCFRAGKFCSINQIFRKIPDSEEVKSLHHPSLHIQWSYKFKRLLCIASFYSDINPVLCVLDPTLWDLFEAFAFISTVHPYSLCGMFARHFSLNLILKPLFILCFFPHYHSISPRSHQKSKGLFLLSHLLWLPEFIPVGLSSILALYRSVFFPQGHIVLSWN